MEYTRAEIINGVWLTHIRSDKFKTACLSITLLTQLQRESAAMNALLPLVLRRGTARYTDMEAISRRLDELYGAAIEPVVRRIGEIQCLGFFASVPEEDYLPAGADTLRGTCELMGQMLLAPNTRGGLLLPDYVDSERDKLIEMIRARLNDKLSYSVSRCIEEMCCCENFAVSRFGDEESAAAIRYQKLTKQYRNLIQTSPIEIFYCGRAEEKRVESLLRDALSTLMTRTPLRCASSPRSSAARRRRSCLSMCGKSSRFAISRARSQTYTRVCCSPMRGRKRTTSGGQRRKSSPSLPRSQTARSRMRSSARPEPT